MSEFSRGLSLDRFLNLFPNWKPILQGDPFFINLKHDGNYTLFKYNQFNTDMGYKFTQQCRGSIYRMSNNGRMECVCRPFDKFFNYGEQYCADIDWSTARVTEKVDGSLCKLWFDKDVWHLSTSGTINAFKAPAGDTEYTFGDVFERALGGSVQRLGNGLDTSKTYMFELTSPETHVVVPYDDGVYYLTCRDTKTGEEDFTVPDFDPSLKIKHPRVFDLKSLDDVLSVVSMMSKDEEGVVVNDAQSHRVKIKSPEYLMTARLMMNGQVTNKRLYQYIKDEKIDDFLAYVPNQKDRVDDIKSRIRAFCEELDKGWHDVDAKGFPDRKSFASFISKDPFRYYYFVKLDYPEVTSLEYLFKQSDRNALRSLGLDCEETKLAKDTKGVSREMSEVTTKPERRLPDVDCGDGCNYEDECECD